jgi:hypothetical protein
MSISDATFDAKCVGRPLNKPPCASAGLGDSSPTPRRTPAARRVQNVHPAARRPVGLRGATSGSSRMRAAGAARSGTSTRGSCRRTRLADRALKRAQQPREVYRPRESPSRDHLPERSGTRGCALYVRRLDVPTFAFTPTGARRIRRAPRTPSLRPPDERRAAGAPPQGLRCAAGAARNSTLWKRSDATARARRPDRKRRRMVCQALDDDPMRASRTASRADVVTLRNPRPVSTSASTTPRRTGRRGGRHGRQGTPAPCGSPCRS